MANVARLLLVSAPLRLPSPRDGRFVSTWLVARAGRRRVAAATF